MKRFVRAPLLGTALLAFAALEPSAYAQDMRLIGSGASFPVPIYATWFKDFSKESNVIVDYQSKGSGAGIQDFINHTVDFAASDAAMTDEEIAKVKDGVRPAPDDRRRDRACLQPARRHGAQAPARRLSGYLPRQDHQVERSRVSPRPTRRAKLPDLPITVVRRSDSSGTTFVFTKHLSAISPAFEAGRGRDHGEWPASDKIVGAPRTMA